ncbi:DNA damage-regulated autophagy modulator protein 1-like [Acanthaster planci]|uniref:DNA damage-regulated autophagy modulator protein 1-like n=1 Tax=Acanthaster planci TaxID=133434 RepID=A0A8B7XS03_ACAPL|nr:DNA damage-regulated autophagy modulator protein 1-like [Acanthaster planci]XP_022082777.1 DNA damage-regulated autophagy modulator protein 1-like [Acanthaster planci]XP_022082778.1 DNA damage-regulated autophagy modulator protein 1-like [Acanthaster planci]XP_022082779.1 DNA damage-regulated autophagy modulator protein 1-like [Acanthaster planci]XP_022082780.1 DNA damage-regulated autophagy modulator protein 1-like [Acanthaster planci]XP_022082781.1 DNA damage-regulated autophagy modulator
MACRPQGLGFLPVSMFLLLVITIGISYLIAVLRGDVPVVFPYISDTGAKPPESCVFAQFVNLSALVLLALVFVRYKELDTIEGLPPRSIGCLNKASLFLGLAGTFGLSLVGNFQDVNVIVVHEIGALTLFLCGTIYAIIHVRISYLLYPEYCRLLVCRLRLLLSLMMLVSLVTCVTFEGVAEYKWMHHHNRTDTQQLWKPTDGGYAFHIVSTSFEWALAISFGLYCLTFFGEFRKVSMQLNMFLHVEPFAVTPVASNEEEPNEYTKLYA